MNSRGFDALPVESVLDVQNPQEVFETFPG